MNLQAVALDTEAWGVEIARTAANVPAAAGAMPTYRILDADGNVVGSGDCTAFGSPAITGAYRFGHVLTGPNFVRKQSYVVLVEYTVSGDARVGEHRFQCA